MNLLAVLSGTLTQTPNRHTLPARIGRSASTAAPAVPSRIATRNTLIRAMPSPP